MPLLSSGLLSVIGWTTLAVLATGVGAFTLGSRRDLPARWLGWSSAVAAGLMLGAAYAVYQSGLDRAPLLGSVGAILGLGLMYGVHAEWRRGGRAGTAPSRVASPRGPIGAEAIHSAPEGIAIGAAALTGGTFGVAFALALALHNAAEGIVFGWRLAPERGRTSAAALAVASKMVQPVTALLTFVIATRWSQLLPATLGFSFGALLYLIVSDLLPTAYAHAGRTSIGVVVCLAAGMVGLLSGAP